MFNNIYKRKDEQKSKSIETFSESYKLFLSKAKTERQTVNEIEKLALKNGFKKIDEFSKISKWDKVYFSNKGKNIALYIIGEEITNGLKITCSHVDSPRLDLKQKPLYESNEFAMLDTHYYGGIKKYQMVTTPLALHGVVFKRDGSMINIDIGDEEDDPVFGITDLLIHLSNEQMQKPVEKAIEGENLDVIVGSIPLWTEEKDSVKANFAKLLNDKFDIKEEDLISAEIEVVPAGKPKDFGLDRSMIAGYGQDDKCCVYSTMKALFEIKEPTYTCCAIFTDKEETGDSGATSAESVFFENSIIALLEKQGKNKLSDLRNTLQNSYMISCDVIAAADPIYSYVSDYRNCAKFNCGVAIEKYLGYGGKYGTNDASPEFLAKLRNVLENRIHFQTAEIGKVDLGGGGTLSRIFSKYNMEVIDCGIPMLNMHSPMEIIAKADLYETFLFCKLFYEIFEICNN